MAAILVRLVVLIAVFASIFLLTQVVLAALARRRAETQAVNKRLTLLRAGMSIESVRSALRKDAPTKLGPDAGLFERAWFAFSKKVQMAALPIDARTVFLFAMIGLAGIAALMLFLTWRSESVV